MHKGLHSFQVRLSAQDLENALMRRTHIELTDDLNGKPATESITFGLDRAMYTIDLEKRNSAKLRKLLTPYVAAGRHVRAQPKRKRAGG